MAAITASRVQRSPNLADQVYEIICDSIVQGELGPGDRLVFDRLARQFGVSQTPVREAVVRLKQDGLVTEGTDGKQRVVPLTGQYVREIYFVRSALEGLAAELAAIHLSDADLDDLRAALEDASRAIERGELDAYRQAGDLVHLRIHAAADNRALARELHALRAHAGYIISYSERHFGSPLALVHHEEHWAVVNALISRAPATARHAMERHIRQAGERITRLIESERGAEDANGDPAAEL